MDPPAEVVARLLPRHAFERVTIGESGAGVWRCTSDGSPPVYLKAAPSSAGLQLDGEADRLRWMKERDLPVPAVRDYGRIGSTEFLLLEEVSVLAASEPEWTSCLPEAITALGAGLALLHRTSTVDCPFDQRVARQIDAARHRVAAGRVREDDFDAIRAGRRATDLLDELLSTIPADEDLVFTHGDFCLPNIILGRGANGEVQITGLVDCGRAGIADRHQDLALAVRSIIHNFGGPWVAPFLQAYGLARPQEEKLRFFTLLDEFF
ncbi:MAG: APH(3') family aminoglycoside O-phosphotransferase [Gemmatimonadaceae bacterium]